jgi:hypothetical protein
MGVIGDVLEQTATQTITEAFHQLTGGGNR